MQKILIILIGTILFSISITQAQIGPIIGCDYETIHAWIDGAYGEYLDARSDDTNTENAVASVIPFSNQLRQVITSCEVQEVAAYAADDVELMRDLRQGGYVIYILHPAATEGNEEAVSCPAQPQLTVEGRGQAEQMGQAFADAGIPIGTVIANHVCLTEEVAQLVTGKSPDEAPYITAFEDLIREVVGTPIEDGTNTIIIGQVPQLSRLALETIEEPGTGYVFLPRDNGNYQRIAEIPYNSWFSLAAAGLQQDFLDAQDQ